MVHPFLNPLQEPEVLSEVIDNSRTSLLRMNFSPEEINFAIDKLGMGSFCILQFFFWWFTEAFFYPMGLYEFLLFYLMK